jgi:isoleucyl-tRNA synthetase
MKAIAAMVAQFSNDEITALESTNGWTGEIDGESVVLELSDFEIAAQDIPGWLVASENGLTVALDITLTDELKAEGIARELVNRVQNLRKESGLDVTDKILLKVDTNELVQKAIASNSTYVCNEVLANEITFESLSDTAFVTDLVVEGDAKIDLSKV